MLLPKHWVTGVIFTSAVLFTLPSFATVADVKPDSPITPLMPDREQAVTTQQIMNNLLRGHYQNQRLNDDLSSRVFDIYLKDLDGTRSYFLASDIADFEQYRFKLDEALSRGDMTPAFTIYNRFQQRINERLSFLVKELKANASTYKFDTNERLELDRDKAQWATTSAELDDLWRKRLKNAILNLQSAGKEPKAAIELLQKRYQNQLNRTHQIKSDDAFEMFMNAVTHAFDPHTQYLSPRSSENFNINMSLSLQGIGAVLQSEDENTKVVRLVPGGPAAKAGNLAPADKIIGVGQAEGDIVDVIGWRLDEVVDLIRGPKGSTVRLEIIPANSGGGESKVLSFVRDEVKLEEQSAQKEIIEIKQNSKTRKIGVIDIPAFYIDFQGRMENKPDYTSTTRDVAKLIIELKKEGIDGLIIDLRNNGGGSLEEAISLTGLFIPTGPVVQVRGANGRVDVLADTDPDVLYDGPLSVVVNRLSASASEIFAGAIQDYNRGIVVGSQTFGKGTVQSLRPLRQGQLKITQAKFYRISGDSTQHKGVIPDISYPSLFDSEKIGESALSESLPWDAIRPTLFMASNTALNKDINQLRKLHEQRAANDPDFNYLNAQRKFIDELRTQTQVSLNKETREKERKTNDDKRLKLENERRKAKNMPLLTSLDELDTDPVDAELSVNNSEAKAEKKGDKNKNGKGKPEKKDKERDAILVETAQILLDYSKLNHSAPLTAQQEKSAK